MNPTGKRFMRQALALGLLPLAQACTNLLVTPGASDTGVALLGDNDDSARRLGAVTHFAAAKHKAGDMREVFDFDTGVKLGEIPQPAQTYNVMANANEYGVTIGETTHGGLTELTLKEPNIMDYGSLILTTLQRSKTAREAVACMANLTSLYGYASSGEGFSITDGQESWYMEVIGKGAFGTGMVWVALRVPDGYVVANANQGGIAAYE